MSWYWTVDGEPACRSPKTLVVAPPTTCAHATREDAERDVQRTRALFPDARFEVIEGHCPAYGRDEDDARRREE